MSMQIGRPVSPTYTASTLPSARVAKPTSSEPALETRKPVQTKESFGAARQSVVGKGMETVNPGVGGQQIKEGIDQADGGALLEQAQSLLESPILQEEFASPAPSSVKAVYALGSDTAVLSSADSLVKKVNVDGVKEHSAITQSGLSSLGENDKLTIVGHGDDHSFGGMSPEKLAGHLKEAGVTSLKKISLKGCNSADFAIKLFSALQKQGIEVECITGKTGNAVIAKNGRTLVEQDGQMLHQAIGNTIEVTKSGVKYKHEGDETHSVTVVKERSSEIESLGHDGLLGKLPDKLMQRMSEIFKKYKQNSSLNLRLGAAFTSYVDQLAKELNKTPPTAQALQDKQTLLTFVQDPKNRTTLDGWSRNIEGGGFHEQAPTETMGFIVESTLGAVPGFTPISTNPNGVIFTRASMFRDIITKTGDVNFFTSQLYSGTSSTLHVHPGTRAAIADVNGKPDTKHYPVGSSSIAYHQKLSDIVRDPNNVTPKDMLREIIQHNYDHLMRGDKYKQVASKFDTTIFIVFSDGSKHYLNPASFTPPNDPQEFDRIVAFFDQAFAKTMWPMMQIMRDIEPTYNGPQNRDRSGQMDGTHFNEFMAFASHITLDTTTGRRKREKTPQAIDDILKSKQPQPRPRSPAPGEH